MTREVELCDVRPGEGVNRGCEGVAGEKRTFAVVEIAPRARRRWPSEMDRDAGRLQVVLKLRVPVEALGEVGIVAMDEMVALRREVGSAASIALIPAMKAPSSGSRCAATTRKSVLGSGAAD